MTNDQRIQDSELERLATGAVVAALRGSRSHSRSRGGIDRESFLPRLYDELRSIAARQIAREPKGHTLQATALANEAWLRLRDQRELDHSDRARFLAAASESIRRVLIDHARKKKAGRRGGALKRVTYEEGVVDVRGVGVELLELEDALLALAVLDPRQECIVRMRVFAGMTVEEIACVLSVSPRTVKGDFAMARAWLARRLGGSQSATNG